MQLIAAPCFLSASVPATELYSAIKLTFEEWKNKRRQGELFEADNVDNK